jgi:hypothetical protein
LHLKKIIFSFKKKKLKKKLCCSAAHFVCAKGGHKGGHKGGNSHGDKAAKPHDRVYVPPSPPGAKAVPAKAPPFNVADMVTVVVGATESATHLVLLLQRLFVHLPQLNANYELIIFDDNAAGECLTFADMEERGLPPVLLQRIRYHCVSPEIMTWGQVSLEIEYSVVCVCVCVCQFYF